MRRPNLDTRIYGFDAKRTERKIGDGTGELYLAEIATEARRAVSPLEPPPVGAIQIRPSEFSFSAPMAKKNSRATLRLRRVVV